MSPVNILSSAVFCRISQVIFIHCKNRTFIPNSCFIPVSICSPNTFGGFWTTEEFKEKKLIVHKLKFPVGV